MWASKPGLLTLKMSFPSARGLPFTVACTQSLSCVQLFSAPWTVAYQAPLSMGFSGKNTGVGCHFLLCGIFLTHVSFIGRQILYYRATWEAFTAEWGLLYLLSLKF